MYWKRNAAAASSRAPRLSTSGSRLRLVYVDPLLAGAVQDDPAVPRRQIVERHVERHAGVRPTAPRASAATAAGSRPATPSSAPSASVSFGSRSSAAGFAPVCVPSPSQAGHQPSELLNEKLCGVERLEAAAALVAGEVLAVDAHRPARLGHVVVADGRRAARPCPATARSRRCRRSASGRRGRTTMRSITTSTACLRRRSIVGGLSSECVSPSMRTRT